MGSRGINTISVQGGWNPKTGESRNTPIVQSTTFKYATSKEMADLFDLKTSGYFYTRLANPTNDAVAGRLCEMEGGVGAMLTSSGQAANFYAVFNICEAGDHLIAVSTIYGGTYNLFDWTMKKMGIECTFVDPEIAMEDLLKEFRPNTKCVFGETIANPALTVLDFDKFSKAAHSMGVPLIVDNSFATAVNCRPFEWGADIVTYSTSKYIDGHGVAVGGCIIDSGNFDWKANAGKFPGLTTPDESYHGMVYADAFGRAAYITKCTTHLMRDLGSIPSPQNAFYINMSIESLPLRMEKHCSNALAVADMLSRHPKVAWVKYPGLPGDRYYERAARYMPNGTTGVVSFGLKGGREASAELMEYFELISIVTHVADARTCVLHPASHTHRQMNDEQLKAAGVAPELIRLSVGLENPEDLIADLEQALSKIK